MGDLTGNIISHAVAVAISPMPFIALILILFTPRARLNSAAFLTGWILGLLPIGLLVLFSGLFDTSGASAPESGSGNVLHGLLKLGFGVLLLVLARRRWGKRPAKGEASELPRWMAAVDRFGPFRSAGMAAMMAGLNPKNLALNFATASSLAAANLAPAREIQGFALFVAIAALGMALPIGAYQILGSRARGRLQQSKDWMVANNDAVMAVLMLVFGAKLLATGVVILFG